MESRVQEDNSAILRLSAHLIWLFINSCNKIEIVLEKHSTNELYLPLYMQLLNNAWNMLLDIMHEHCSLSSL